SKQATNLRKEVFLATGVSKATVARVVAEFNKTGKIAPSDQDDSPLFLQALVFELSELDFVISKAQLAHYLKKLVPKDGVVYEKRRGVCWLYLELSSFFIIEIAIK
ncbi:5282_t:CDS:2, partial [Scutellospora calospora]